MNNSNVAEVTSLQSAIYIYILHGGVITLNYSYKVIDPSPADNKRRKSVPESLTITLMILIIWHIICMRDFQLNV